MALHDLINKYKEDGNELRLTIILESANKKATKKNIQALKLLIQDDDADSLALFLNDTVYTKSFNEGQEAIKLQEELSRPKHQDDLVIFAKKAFGSPEDPNSLGNRVLDARTHTFQVQSHIRPEILLKKFSTLAKKDFVEIDFYPNLNQNPPIYECCILGTKTLSRENFTRVN